MNKDIEITFTLPGKFLDRVVERCNENKNIPASDIINDELGVFLNDGYLGDNNPYPEDVIGDVVITKVLEVIKDQIYKDE